MQAISPLHNKIQRDPISAKRAQSRNHKNSQRKTERNELTKGGDGERRLISM